MITRSNLISLIQFTISGINIEYYKYKIIDSTQQASKSSRNLITPNKCIVFGAMEQTKGLGSGNKSWISPYGNIYITIGICVRKNLADSTQFIVSQIIIQYLQQIGINATFKPPNDVIVKGNKICGVIAWSYSDSLHLGSRPLSIGIGLNVNTQPDHQQLDYPATSISYCTGQIVSQTLINIIETTLIKDVVIALC